MAKDKVSSKSKSKVAAPAPVKETKAVKPEKVKAGRVTKPAETVKTKAKETAKEVAKKSKKQKEPTPEPTSSDDESDDETSASSASSESESEEKPVAIDSKTNGVAKKAAAKETTSESEDDSDSASDSDEETPAAGKIESATPTTNGATTTTSDSSDDDSEADSDSDASSEDEKPAVNGKVLAKETKKVNAKADSDASSDEDSDSGAGSDSDDSDTSASDEEEEAKPAPADKKRKAEVESTPAAKKTKTADAPANATGNLFVGNLSWNVDEEWLTREFETFGELAGVRIITDRESGKSKGFGYVEFTDPNCAAAALEARQGYSLDNRELRVDFSTPRDNNKQSFTPGQRSNDRAQRFGDVKGEPTATLFVGNISFDADQDQVSELFAEYGTIQGVRLPTDRETGQPKGFGYVEMASVDEAAAALEGLQGAELAGRPVRLDYASQRPQNDSPAGGRGGGFRGGRGGGRGGFGDRGGRGGGRGGGFRGGRGDSRGGRPNTTNRGGFGDFSGKKISF